MRAICKAFYNFFGDSAQSACGWSEVYPMEVSDYATADSQLNSIITARLPTLPITCAIVGALISDSDVKGDSYPSTGTYPTNGGVTGAAGPTTFVLRWKFFAGTLKRATRFVRLIPSSEIASGGGYLPTLGFGISIQNWATLVTGFCSCATRIHGAVTPPFYTFTAYTADRFIRAETKKIGRPFFLPVGRRLIA
jgi:hypothetical protein